MGKPDVRQSRWPVEAGGNSLALAWSWAGATAAWTGLPKDGCHGVSPQLRRGDCNPTARSMLAAPSLQRNGRGWVHTPGQPGKAASQGSLPCSCPPAPGEDEPRRGCRSLCAETAGKGGRARGRQSSRGTASPAQPGGASLAVGSPERGNRMSTLPSLGRRAALHRLRPGKGLAGKELVERAPAPHKSCF